MSIIGTWEELMRAMTPVSMLIIIAFDLCSLFRPHPYRFEVDNESRIPKRCPITTDYCI